MTINDHFETQKCHFWAFLASFKILFSSLQHPIYNILLYLIYIFFLYYIFSIFLGQIIYHIVSRITTNCMATFAAFATGWFRYVIFDRELAFDLRSFFDLRSLCPINFRFHRWCLGWSDKRIREALLCQTFPLFGLLHRNANSRQVRRVRHETAL